LKLSKDCDAKVVRFYHLYIMSLSENNNQIFTVGLTGGIGSGKSTIGKVFEALGIPRFDSDKYAHHIYATDGSLRNSVVERFGEAVGTKDTGGEIVDIDRKSLGRIVFADKDALVFLNNLVHPAVKKGFDKWLGGLPPSTPYVIREAAILFESGSESGCNKVLSVNANKEERIDRVVRRDGLTRSEILAVMNRQMTDEERIVKSNFQITNNNSDFILSDLQKLHKHFLELSLSSKNDL